MASASEPRPWYDEVVTPALVGSAHRTYRLAIGRALREAGFDDMPRRGISVVGGIANNGDAPQEEFGRYLGVSKQAASQLVDVLVTRGYIERATDPSDRRRVNLTLTDRGRAAAAASAAAVARVDAAVARRCSAEDRAAMRRVLGAMADIGQRAIERRRARESREPEE
jgi:DNA-binding MarR family transcriptional regulator